MFFVVLATVCAGLFAGAAIYITFVEHPARLECGTELAAREFGPSYRRATVMQASLAAVGLVAAIAAWVQGRGTVVLIAGLVLGLVIPFTLVVILPTNKRLLDPSLDPGSADTAALLVRWGRLHAVRSVLGAVAFGLLALLAGCGDSGTDPAAESLVPRILAVTPEPQPPTGERRFLIDLEVRTQGGDPYPDAVVSWEATHGAVLAPALTDSEGRLQALWTFNLAEDPSGTEAELRACARREPADPCGYTEPAVVEVP